MWSIIGQPWVVYYFHIYFPHLQLHGVPRVSSAARVRLWRVFQDVDEAILPVLETTNQETLYCQTMVKPYTDNQ